MQQIETLDFLASIESMDEREKKRPKGPQERR